MKLIIITFILLISINLNQTKELPPGIEICHQSDPKVNKCLQHAIENSLKIIKNGIPSLNVPSIEPLKFDYVSVEQLDATSAFNMKSSFVNAEMHGLSESKLIRAAARFTKFAMKSESFTNRMDFTGQYTMNGQILVLPIRGEGFANISLHELTTRHEITGDYYKGSDDNTYVNITHYKVKLIPKWVTFRFDNLFNGDKLLGNTMNKFMNENWQPVFEGLIPGYEMNFGEKFMKIANILFSQVPFDLVFPK